MARRRKAKVNLPVEAGLAGFHAGITLWHRLPMLAFARGNGGELNRMIAEKAAAFTEGSFEAQREVAAITRAALTGKLDPVDAANSIAAAALKPSFRAVKANARRLSKKR